VGNGTNSIDNKISLPEFMKIPNQNLSSLIDTIFPNISRIGLCNDQYLSERTILSLRNEDVEYINQEILNITLKPNRMPPSKLNLKIGCPIILLRNIAPGEGLCNSTRLVVTQLEDHIIKARILCGNYAEKLTFIPCITLTPSTSELPFIFKRRRVAFGMTINKSQGQSVKYVGLNL
ncbi:30832_t:CDS:2, partial [Gigaspora margarita]